jgi:hypothetical protein
MKEQIISTVSVASLSLFSASLRAFSAGAVTSSTCLATVFRSTIADENSNASLENQYQQHGQS